MNVVQQCNACILAWQLSGGFAMIFDSDAGLFIHPLYSACDTGVPYIRVIPPVTAVAGETLRLKCPVAGYPIDEIYWEQGRLLFSVLRFSSNVVIQAGKLYRWKCGRRWSWTGRWSSARWKKARTWACTRAGRKASRVAANAGAGKSPW